MTATATAAGSRRLKRTAALLGGFLGIGYLYVGRLKYAAALIVATYLGLFIAAWTRWLVEPAGWYAYVLSLLVIFLIQCAHPLVIAWSRPAAPPKAYNRWWWYGAWVVGTAALSAFVIPDPSSRLQRFGYDFFRVPSVSMSPTLESGDHIVVDGWRYEARPPQFGEIIAYRQDDGRIYVKRVVGVPGDTVAVRGTTLLRNGSPVDEPYLHAADSGSGFRMPDFPPATLGDSEFFVLGDYRDNSDDSRRTGPVTRGQIVGRAEFVAFSYAAGRVRWERFPVMLAEN